MSRRARFSIGCAVVGVAGVALAAVIVFLGQRWLSRGYWDYVEQRTGIILPATVSEVDTFDNLEWFTVLHVRLAEDDVDAFAAQYGFDATPVLMSTMFPIETLKPENRDIPTSGDLVYLEGHSGCSWTCALDRDSGRLWIVMFYPDPGGTCS